MEMTPFKHMLLLTKSWLNKDTLVHQLLQESHHELDMVTQSQKKLAVPSSSLIHCVMILYLIIARGRLQLILILACTHHTVVQLDYQAMEWRKQHFLISLMVISSATRSFLLLCFSERNDIFITLSMANNVC